MTLEEATRKIAELEAKISRIGTPERNYTPSLPQYEWTEMPPHWECVVQDGGTFTEGAGSDWSTQFEPISTISNRVPYRLATAGGELILQHPDGGSDLGPRRARIQIYAAQPQTIKCVGSYTGTGGAVQFTVNGNITELTVDSYSDYFDLYIPSGYSTITISTNASVDSLTFQARLFDNIFIQWVNPYAAKNPKMPGYNTVFEGQTGTAIEAAPLSEPS